MQTIQKIEDLKNEHQLLLAERDYTVNNIYMLNDQIQFQEDISFNCDQMCVEDEVQSLFHNLNC